LKSERFLSQLAVAAAAITFLGSSAISQGLDVPARHLPVPETVSPQVQKLIGAPLRSEWDVLPKTGEEWKPIAEAGVAVALNILPGLRERMKVKVDSTTIDGVRAFIVTPETVPFENRNRVLIHMHGGCYVLFPREAALPEAVMMAGFGGFKVITGGLFSSCPRRWHDGLQEYVEGDGREEHRDLRHVCRRCVDA
jgi:epsilon-lactone hydrolase